MAAAAKSIKGADECRFTIGLGFHYVRLSGSQKSHSNPNIFMRLECLA
jgi:hypothetical protein